MSRDEESETEPKKHEIWVKELKSYKNIRIKGEKTKINERASILVRGRQRLI